MKTRGTRKGILLSLDKDDSPEALELILQNPEHRAILSNNVMIEIADKLDWATVKFIA